MTHTGEILRRRDGNYCFSCYHCDEYFDVIHEIITHLNNVFEVEIVQSKLDGISSTEFVDATVSIDVNCGLINDGCVIDNNVSSEENIEDYGSVNDEDVVNTNQDCLQRTFLGRKVSAESNNYKVTTTNLIRCCWCSETFNDLGLVQNHLTDDHNKKSSDVYCCEHCHIFFKNLKLLSQHIKSYHGPAEYDKFQMDIDYQENTKPIRCAVCQLWINGTKSFDAHTKEYHKMYRILQCYVCKIFKKKPSGLLDHLKVHDRFRKYRCYECDNVEPKITNPNDLRSHKCVLCGIWFPNHSSIRNHLNDIHGQDQIYDCTICDDFSFKSEWDLQVHGINVHCKSMQSLNAHKKMHSTVSSTNVCPICESKFRRKDYLMRHIKSHNETRSKDFKCYICKKDFQSNGYLKNHIKRHTEKKIHQCHVCGVRFLLAGLLRKHMKEHEGEVWRCTQCQKEFSNKSKLTAHEKTHVTERNFRCDVGVLH